MCLLMYLSTTVTPVGMHEWRLVSKQIMYDNMVKYSFNNIKYVLREVLIANKYCCNPFNEGIFWGSNLKLQNCKLQKSLTVE